MVNETFLAALAKAQGAFPTIPRDKTVKVKTRTGSEYSFKYAPLDTETALTRKPLADNGLSVMQSIEKIDGVDHIVTILAHSDGGCIRLAPVRIIEVDTGPQALGSAITYARRRSFELALNLVGDDDDDANIAEGNDFKAQGQSAEKPGAKKPGKAAGAKPAEPTEEEKEKVREATQAAKDTFPGAEEAVDYKEVLRSALAAYCHGDEKEMAKVLKELTTFKGTDNKNHWMGLDGIEKASDKWLKSTITKLDKKAKA